MKRSRFFLRLRRENERSDLNVGIYYSNNSCGNLGRVVYCRTCSEEESRTAFKGTDEHY